jgi:hypothetical protein
MVRRERVEMATRLAMLEAERVLPRNDGETEDKLMADSRGLHGGLE